MPISPDGDPPSRAGDPLDAALVPAAPGGPGRAVAPATVAAVAAALDAAFAPETRRVYRSLWRAWQTWCVAHGIAPLPAGPHDLALYLAERAPSCSVATLEQVVAAVNHYHREAGHTPPGHSEGVKRVMRGLRRQHGAPVRKAAPLLVPDLRALASQAARVSAPTAAPPPARSGANAETHRLRALRDRALLVLAFAGAFRRSEVVALNVEDVVFEERGLRVTLRRGKTDQEGHGTVKGAPYGSDPATCPVRALRCWLAGGGPAAGALFVAVTPAGRLGARLSGAAVAEILRARAVAAGLATKYSGHSMRRGLATEAARAGKRIDEIMRQGGWRDVATVMEYIESAGLLSADNAASGIGL